MAVTLKQSASQAPQGESYFSRIAIGSDDSVDIDIPPVRIRFKVL